MNDREIIYDEEIAPALLQIGKRCEELGMSIVATVEYGNDEYGSTSALTADASFAMRLILLAVRVHGNVDRLILNLLRYGAEHGHTSMCLHTLGCDFTQNKEGGDAGLWSTRSSDGREVFPCKCGGEGC